MTQTVNIFALITVLTFTVLASHACKQDSPYVKAGKRQQQEERWRNS